MDLSSLDTSKACDEGSVMQLRHPGTGEPLENDDKSPMTLTLLGRDSPRFKAAQNARVNRRIQTAAPGTKITAEAIDSDGVDLVVDATTGWNVTIDGDKPEFTSASAKAAYIRFPWMREQADAWIANRANFLKA